MSGVDDPRVAVILVKNVESFDLISLPLAAKCSVKSSLPLKLIAVENDTANVSVGGTQFGTG